MPVAGNPCARTSRNLSDKIKKGHRKCPLNASLREKCAFPRRAPLTQRRDYNNTLGRMLPGNFGLEPAHRQLLTLVVSCPPDLGQKVLSAVAMKNQLGRLWRLARCALNRQER